jgi:hypothetical protein
MLNTKDIFSAFAALFLFFQVNAQHDVLSPIGVRYELDNAIAPVKSGNTIDSLVLYNLDTLSLPILDDFSKNRFQQYNAKQCRFHHHQDLFIGNHAATSSDT